MSKGLNKTFINGVFWASFSKIGYVLLALLGNMFLARFISAEEFGVIGVAMFFVGIFNVLIEGGVGGALVRKENVTPKDYSTVFIFNLAVSLILFGVMFVIAEPIALYYEKPILKEVLWALSLLLVINAFTVVQNTKLIRDMSFKQKGIYQIISLGVATIIACYLAYKGFGVWAIVSLQIISAFILMLILWFKLGRIGSFVFSKKSFKEIFSFGVFTTLSSILNIAFDNAYQLIIGKYFSFSQVGYYYQAKKLYQAPDGVFRTVISQVFYSYLSKFQKDTEVFITKFNLMAKLTAIIIGLMVSLIYLYAEQVILLLYGDKWGESVFFIRLIALSGFFILLEQVNRNIFKIFNQTHKILYLEIFNKAIQAISIAIGIYYLNLNVLLYGLVVTSIISYVINLYFSLYVINKIHYDIFLNVLKITLSAGFSVVLFLHLYEYFHVGLYSRILIFPIFVFLYLFILKIIKVFNKDMLISIKKVLNRK
ncbi:lipopolysaccharide biosynthesis protein [Tenacibaculum finnmarkense]|uniref:lipopolysaccharide biosynthesis protein n=1 Tax=Tenacibaculum finnmarkense TaxID=2781243 RepID=UPI001EFB53CC|nr:lipopolysaccharide biosynthesis protein [Tenacibaculum finnmarkense]MCG8803619.1 lipopolysaccharide biosynthesis protein [Tenacibaculum finnmarkense]MCG8826434.1 lipopolysaccharide biosynthesis protein [Tenacibaculum finnmarkense]